MNWRFPHSLRRSRAGTTSIEFAMAGMALILLTVGVIEMGVVMWSWQALQGAATDAARCAAINAVSCKNVATTPSNTQTYASAAAQMRGLSGVSSSNVTVATGAAAQTACGTSANVVSVVVSYQIGANFIAALSSSITASACFPLATG